MYTKHLDEKNRQARAKLWIPVLNGKIYCSPACGRGCTKAEYDRVVKKADKLVSLLKGSGWKVKIYENLGWHFQVVSGPIAVFGNQENDLYWCMIAQSSDLVGSGFPPWSCSPSPGKANYHKDPNEAVKEALTHAGAWVSDILKTMVSASEVFGLPIDSFLTQPTISLKIQTSYRDDAAWMLRLEDAITKDASQSEEWKREAVPLIRAMATRLLKKAETDMKR